MERKRAIRNERGVTSVEYGLIAAAIAVVILVVVFSIGSDVAALFNKMHF